MNICEAISAGAKTNKAITWEGAPINIAWFHGMDNSLRWWNEPNDGVCVHSTDEEVDFAIADFKRNDFKLHETVPYHGILAAK